MAKQGIDSVGDLVQLFEFIPDVHFRKFMKETPLKYLNKTRMRAACQLLLRSDIPIAEVAKRSGFADSSYFAKRFLLYLRISPSEYRQKFGKRG